MQTNQGSKSFANFLKYRQKDLLLCLILIIGAFFLSLHISSFFIAPSQTLLNRQCQESLRIDSLDHYSFKLKDTLESQCSNIKNKVVTIQISIHILSFLFLSLIILLAIYIKRLRQNIATRVANKPLHKFIILQLILGLLLLVIAYPSGHYFSYRLLKSEFLESVRLLGTHRQIQALTEQELYLKDEIDKIDVAMIGVVDTKRFALQYYISAILFIVGLFLVYLYYFNNRRREKEKERKRRGQAPKRDRAI